MIWSVLAVLGCSDLMGLVCLPLLLVVLVSSLILFVFGLFAIAFGVLCLLFMVGGFGLGGGFVVVCSSVWILGLWVIW